MSDLFLKYIVTPLTIAALAVFGTQVLYVIFFIVIPGL